MYDSYKKTVHWRITTNIKQKYISYNESNSCIGCVSAVVLNDSLKGTRGHVSYQCSTLEGC